MRLLATLCGILGPLLLSGCTRDLTLTEEDAGRTVHVARGETFTVRLEGNHTTGYQWFLESPPDGVLAQEGEPTYYSDSDLINGAGGDEVWTFLALRPGTGTLGFAYKQTPEDERGRQVTYTVEVQ